MNSLDTPAHVPYETADGSLTCFNTEFNEHYHNRSGALAETQSLYVIPSRFEERANSQSVVRILDPFFGLGYNTWAAMNEVDHLKNSGKLPDSAFRLEVVAFEYDATIVEKSAAMLGEFDPDNLKRFLPHLEHNLYYQTQCGISDNLFKFLSKLENNNLFLQLFIGDVRALIQEIPDQSFDLIYHDAFSPKKQPELWTQTLFEQYHRILNPEGGVVLTYSASASVRQGLVEAGFDVRLNPFECHQFKPGTAAYIKAHASSQSLDAKSLALMNSKSGLPYIDSPTLDWSREAIIAYREGRMASSALPTSSAIHREFKST